MRLGPNPWITFWRSKVRILASGVKFKFKYQTFHFLLTQNRLKPENSVHKSQTWNHSHSSVFFNYPTWSFCLQQIKQIKLIQMTKGFVQFHFQFLDFRPWSSSWEIETIKHFLMTFMPLNLKRKIRNWHNWNSHKNHLNDLIYFCSLEFFCI